MSSGGAVTTEGPAATREPAAVCGVCGRGDVLGGCPQIGDGTDESVFECWGLGLTRLRARLVEVERERDEARGAFVRLVEGLRANDARAAAAESRASAAEGAIRELAGAVRDGATGTRMSLALIAADLALSGLPPLTGETAGPVAQALDAREREVMEAWRTYFGELSEVLFPGASLVGWKHIIARARKLTSLAQPTPAALVPKEAATPKAIAGPHKEEGT